MKWKIKKMENKKSILIITGGYFPGVNFGGISTSRYNFTEAFGDEYDIVIVTRNHDYKTSEPFKNITDGYNQYGKARVLYFPDQAFNGSTFGKIMDELKPDIIYCSGTITTYFHFNKDVIVEARERNIPVLITPDGDVLDNAMRHKPAKKMGAAMACRLGGVFKDVWFQATTPGEVKNLPKYLGIKPKKITLIPNMPCIFSSRTDYIKEAGNLKVVFASRIHPIKNLHFAIECICQLKQNVIFDIFGPMEDEAYWEECKKAIAKAPQNITITYKGRLDSAKAREVAKDYDCFFLPTTTENYGYAIEEALISGCPVIITSGTTPWDDVHNVAGFAAELGDINSFVAILGKIADMNNAQYSTYCSDIRSYIEKKLSFEQLCEEYKKLFNKIIKNH